MLDYKYLIMKLASGTPGVCGVDIGDWAIRVLAHGVGVMAHQRTGGVGARVLGGALVHWRRACGCQMRVGMLAWNQLC